MQQKKKKKKKSEFLKELPATMFEQNSVFIIQRLAKSFSPPCLGSHPGNLARTALWGLSVATNNTHF